ncbi:MAG: hypothetical protein H0W86_02440 [Armatimonadetes bacterium]|nr:hypothetical protein [Armatimonadota bacterium]
MRLYACGFDLIEKTDVALGHLLDHVLSYLRAGGGHRCTLDSVNAHLGLDPTTFEVVNASFWSTTTWCTGGNNFRNVFATVSPPNPPPSINIVEDII